VIVPGGVYAAEERGGGLEKCKNQGDLPLEKCEKIPDLVLEKCKSLYLCSED